MAEAIDPEKEELEKLNRGVVDQDPKEEVSGEIEGETLDENGDPIKEVPAKADNEPEAEKPKPEAAEVIDTKVPEKQEDEPQARPERFIPMKKYHDEKRQWEEELGKREARIKELETISQKETGSKSSDDAIKKYVEKHGADEEALRDLLSILPKGAEIPQETLDRIAHADALARETEERAFFEKEFESSVLPLIKEKYPDADQAFIDSVKTRLDQLAHTKQLATTPMQYIFHAHAGEFAPQEKGKKTAEAGRPGAARTQVLTAADFKGSKDFSALENVDAEARRRIIKDMDPDTWANFVQWAGNENEGVEVNRDGRKIVLK